MIRSFLRRHFFTHNTIRYRIEYRCVKRAFAKIDTPVDRLLDAGAGSGEMSRLAYRNGFARKIVGVEPGERNFSLLRRNYASLGGDAECHQASLEEIPLESESFDAVLTTQVFEHIEDHEAAAREVNRVLKPGGHLIFSVPHPPEMCPNDGHVRPGYTPEEVEQLWSPHGYEVLLTEYFLPLSTFRRCIAAGELPASGKFVPLRWVDREKHLSNEQRQADQPYGILTLLRKP